MHKHLQPGCRGPVTSILAAQGTAQSRQKPLFSQTLVSLVVDVPGRGRSAAMYRKGLISILLDHPTSLHELSLQLRMPEREVEDDLHHLIKSLRHLPYRVMITPASCKRCGFVFHKDKLHKPGRCPSCKNTWISEPLVGIEEKR